jgi:hypothetical protein
LGKTNIEIFGEEKAKEISKNISEGTKKGMNNPKTKQKLRKAKIEQIQKNGGNAVSSFNYQACEIFKKFDEINNTQGRYAIYGNGEYRVPRLYYSLDYINFDLKLIIEVDEKHHFDKSTGLLKEKDIIRQKEIQEKFPDFKFLRFKDTEIYKILEIKI